MPKLSINLIGSSSLVLLVLFMATFVLPTITQPALAETCIDSANTDCYNTNVMSEISVTTSTSVSIAVDPSVNLRLIPTPDGATGASSAKLNVSTNSRDGYALYLQTGNTTGALTNVASDISDEISNTTKSNVLVSDLEANSYGYALAETTATNDTTYSHIPTEGGIIRQTSTPTSSNADTGYAYSDTYYLSFGVNVGTNITAGTYTGNVLLSAVANPTTIATLYDVTYMQEMQPSICENTKEGYTKQLIDNRDGNSYWVAKLKDGNCWMTQNLALDITEEGLKASDTDIIEDWDQNSEYPPTNTNSIVLTGPGTNLPTTATSTGSWNVGKSLRIPLFYEANCRNGNSLSVEGDQTLGEACSNIGFIDVDDSWQPTFVASEGTWIAKDGSTYAGVVTADPSNKTYDAHYLVGNYYQWTAFTAGTGGDMEAGTASQSICPKGWKLPTSTSSDAEISGSFYYLFSHYNLANKTDLTIGSAKNDQYNIFLNPLYFVPAGSVYVYGSSVISAGTSMSLPSSSAADTAEGEPGFNYFSASIRAITGSGSNFVNFQRNEGRRYGHSVRCLAH